MPFFLTGVIVSAGCATAAVAGLWLFRRALSLERLQHHRDSVAVFTTIVTTLYAVVLAFVVVIVWQQYSDARAAVQREASQIIDLARLMAEVPPPANARLHEELVRFTQDSLDHEWPSLASGRSDPAAEQALNQLWHGVVSEIKGTAPAEQAILNASLQRLTDLSDSRRACLHASADAVPPVLWMLLWGGAVVSIGFTYLLAPESGRWHAVMTLALAASIGFVLFLVATLDNPFAPGAGLSPQPIQRALAAIQTIR